jgi:hypothetical protein
VAGESAGLPWRASSLVESKSQLLGDDTKYRKAVNGQLEKLVHFINADDETSYESTGPTVLILFAANSRHY